MGDEVSTNTYLGQYDISLFRGWLVGCLMGFQGYGCGGNYLGT